MSRQSVDGDHPDPGVDWIETASFGALVQVVAEGQDFSQSLRVKEYEQVFCLRDLRSGEVDLLEPFFDFLERRWLESRCEQDL